MSASAPPYQSAKRSGSVHSRQTRSRGASNTRVVVKPVSSAIVAQSRIQAVEAAVPEAAVAREPFGGGAERLPVQARRPELLAATAGDEAGALEHLDVARHGLH